MKKEESKLTSYVIWHLPYKKRQLSKTYAFV